MNLLAQGREAEVFLHDDGTVVKLMRDPAGRDRVERELAVCRVLGDLAPTALGIVTVDGRPGLVMTRIEGDSLLTMLERSPQRLFTAARVLAHAQLAMHEREAPAELPDLKEMLAVRITAAEPLPDDLRARALQLLAGLPGGDRLCHGDLHLGNMLGGWDAPVIIDWGNSARGDPIADVARSDMLQRMGALPPGMSPVFRALVRVGRRVLTSRYLRVYARERPIDVTFERWQFVVWAARFVEGIPEEHPALLRLLRSVTPR